MTGWPAATKFVAYTILDGHALHANIPADTRRAEAIAQRMGVEAPESAETIQQTRGLAPEEAADVRNAEWDSRERRAETSVDLAEGYRSAGIAEDTVAEDVEADRIADAGQALPAHAAVAAGTVEGAKRSAGAGAARSQARVRIVKRSR